MRSKDFNEATHPGNVPGEPSVVNEEASEDEVDEFPSEATRIDPKFLSASAPPQRPKKAPESIETLAAARVLSQQGERASQREVRPPQRETRAPSLRSNKLAALQSLSLDSGGTSSTRLPPSPRQSGGSKLPWVLLLLIAAGYGGKMLLEKYRPTDPVRVDAPALRVETVQASGGSGNTYVAHGFIDARDPTSIGAPMGGQVKEVRVQVNDHVTKGQVVVVLDSSAAEAELSGFKIEVAEAERALSQAEMLYKASAATLVQIGAAKSAVAIARSRTRAPESRIAQARIHTLSSGTVLEVLVHPGETIPPNGTLVKIADLHQLVADVDVLEADITKLHRGQQVEVTSESFLGKMVKGTVSVISEQASRSAGTVKVRVDLAVTEDFLKTNMSVKCTFLPVQGDTPHIFVSRSAVTPQGTAFVVGPNRIVGARVVKIGAAQGSAIEIVSGLTAGEQIVSEALSVHDGQQLPP